MSIPDASEAGPAAPGVLAGVRVVEFAQNVAIPHCGRLLAGMGADVVKVEPPSGDAMRWSSDLAPWEGRAYAIVNQGKRSVAIDLAAVSPAASSRCDTHCVCGRPQCCCEQGCGCLDYGEQLSRRG